MSLGAQVSTQWPQHSMDRPQPRVVDPGPYRPSGAPPSDAIVLFDGKSLDHWRSANDVGGPARWKLVDGAMEVVAKTGSIATTQGFGDVQLHLEFREPTPPKGESQERGNSGVFLMGRYEVQVLDSYHNVTYADGHAAAIYGQYPPLVNASRPPGEWQTYEIVFHRPRFDAAGKVAAPARMTVIHNGVLVQDNAVLSGPTANKARPPYAKHPDALPLTLQDHGDPVRFRNIWIRKLE
jgi:prepilin-type processing-associated H-X9-DG protein